MPTNMLRKPIRSVKGSKAATPTRRPMYTTGLIQLHDPTRIRVKKGRTRVHDSFTIGVEDHLAGRVALTEHIEESGKALQVTERARVTVRMSSTQPRDRLILTDRT